MKYLSHHVTRQQAGVYKISSLFDNRVYIGSAVNLDRRYKKHLRDLTARKHHNTYLQRFSDKHGLASLFFTVLETVADKSLLLQREQFWIDSFRSSDRHYGFNIFPTAGSRLGSPCSPETKEKIRKGNLGKRPANYGVSPSEETIQKRREKATGKRHSEETKAKLALYSGQRNSQFGVKRTSAQIQQIKDRESKKVLSLNDKMEVVRRYPSMTSALQDGYHRQFIRKAIKSGKPYKSLFWRFDTD